MGTSFFNGQGGERFDAHTRCFARAVGAAPRLDRASIDEASCRQRSARTPGDVGVIAGRKAAHRRFVLIATACRKLGDKGTRVGAPGISIFCLARQPDRGRQDLIVHVCAQATRQE